MESPWSRDIWRINGDLFTCLQDVFLRHLSKYSAFQSYTDPAVSITLKQKDSPLQVTWFNYNLLFQSVVRARAEMEHEKLDTLAASVF